MNHQRFWLQVAAFLVLVWGVVAVVMWVTEDAVFTPEKTLALMRSAPWHEDANLSHEQRQHYLDKVITSVARLDLAQRDTLREDGQEEVDRYMQTLTEDEKAEYISRVVEEHFKAVMRGVEKLPADDRRRIIGSIYRDMKKRAADRPELQLFIGEDPAAFEKNFAKDMGLLFKEAPAKVKLEMAPMFESMHARMQGLRLR